MVALLPHSHKLHAVSSFPSKYYLWVHTKMFSDKIILVGCQLSHSQRKQLVKQSTYFLKKAIILVQII